MEQIKKDTYPIISLFKSVIHPKDIATLKLDALPNRKALFCVNIPDGVLAFVFYPCDAPNVGLPTEPPLPIAVLARVLSVMKSGPHQEEVVVQGLRRVELDYVIHHNEAYSDGPHPYDRAVITEIFPEVTTQNHFNLISEVIRLYENIAKTHTGFPKDKLGILESYKNDPEYFVDLIIQTVQIERRQTIKMMREISTLVRLEIIRDWMKQVFEEEQVSQKLDRKTKVEMESTRHDYYLRQKLKTIRKELGEDDHSADEADRYEELLENLHLNEDSAQEVSREIERLRHIQPSSNEFQVIKTFLDRFFALPWGVETREHIDLSIVRASLEAEHFGLNQVKERILEFLAVRKLNPNHKGPILCFAGPPGVGKTSLGKAIAESIGRNFFRISVGGVHDEAEIRGHRRTYVGAMPGKIMNALARAKCQNPLLMLDEIDKIGSDHRGDPAAALLEVLDPEQNTDFTDHYFNVPFDLSKVMFIVTANYLHDIPKPLLDRLEVITIEGYTESEKVKISQHHLLPKILEDHGLSQQAPEVNEIGLRHLIRGWTREAGVRNLQRALQKVCRKIARERVEEERNQQSLDSLESVQNYLGPEQYQSDEGIGSDVVGAANGLAWTSVGGEVLVIEAIKMKGSGKLVITGKLGEVMRESVHAAHSLIRSKASSLGIDSTLFESEDLHVHFPAGAVPKDGPSAGVTITLAIASLLSQRAIRSEFAMTGEVTLRGKVLPVGGVKDKILAAYRVGLSQVVIPEANAKDLIELPKEVSESMTFHKISHVDQLFDLALLPYFQATLNVDRLIDSPEDHGEGESLSNTETTVNSDNNEVFVPNSEESKGSMELDS